MKDDNLQCLMREAQPSWAGSWDVILLLETLLAKNKEYYNDHHESIITIPSITYTKNFAGRKDFGWIRWELHPHSSHAFF